MITSIKLHIQDRSIEAQKFALEKTPGLGSRIDIVLTLVRIGFFFGDHDLITTYLAKAEACVTNSLDLFLFTNTYAAVSLKRVVTGIGVIDSRSILASISFQFVNLSVVGPNY